MREASSRVVIDALVARGARVSAYDPVAGSEARSLYRDNDAVEIVENALEAASGADALVIVTEWKAFRSPDFDELKRLLKSPVIFDGRNLYEPAVVRSHGFEYHPIGR
jgi:UDPglucose 6-dehydrogenase